MTAQVDLTYPALRTGGDAQRQALIVAQGLPALEQWGDGEVIMGQARQTAGQRAFVEQPVKGRLVEVGRQL
ncbi:hypothetical protein D3C71_1843490 [compost metagenome]